MTVKIELKNIYQKFNSWFKQHLFVGFLFQASLIVFFSEILSRRSLIEALEFMILSFPTAILNVMIVFATLMISLLTKKRIFWKYFISLFWIMISVVSCIMFSFRLMPFSFMDILLLPSTFTVLPVYLSVWQMVLIGALVIGVVCFIIFVYKKSRRYDVNLKKNAAILTVSVIMTVTYIFVCKYAGFVDNRITGLIDKYENNGFAYCFSSSIVDMGMNVPDEYSDSRVADVVNEIDNYDDDAVIDANIVFVQLESFFDVNTIEGISYSQNPLPVFTGLKEEYSHGYLEVPTYSAGTANTEFEILTGMNTDYFGIGEFPYQTVADKRSIESVAYALKDDGYKTHALHNNSAKFYSRDIVYSNLGFDTFTSLEYMYDVKYNSMNWAKDKVLVSGITDAISSTEERDFVYSVTVQTHGSYPDDVDEHQLPIKVSGIEDESLRKQYAYYVNQMAEVDAFIGTLVSELEALSEPAILVMFGDHLPGIGMVHDSPGYSDMYRTEYVIWSSFETDYIIKNIESYQLYSYVLDRLNLEGGLLQKLHRKYNFSYNEQYAENFELLQYHMLYSGQDSGAYGIKAYEPTKLKLGVLDISVTDANFVTNVLYVHGNNFNEFSKVFVNDRELETLYIDRHTLAAPEAEFENSDSLRVGQVDSSSNVLSYSNEYNHE